MKSIRSSVYSRSLFISFLVAGCGTPQPPGPDAVASGPTALALKSSHDGSIQVELDSVGDPRWKPTDFHHFVASIEGDFWDIASSLLPPPDHVSHPQLGIGPGAAHAGPYGSELAAGAMNQGYQDQKTFTAAQFNEGTYMAFMVVPTGGAPRGSSPDFPRGPIIPNSIFPISVELHFYQEGVDTAVISDHVPALDGALNPAFAVDGHSHFPYFMNDAGFFYPPPVENRYERRIVLRDANGDGWNVRVPFRVR